MQENLVFAIITPDIGLQPCNRIRNIDSHTRRSTNEHTRPPAEDTLPVCASCSHLLEHVSQVGTAVFGTPAFLFLGAHEGEAHEVLLEFGWGGGEAEIEG